MPRHAMDYELHRPQIQWQSKGRIVPPKGSGRLRMGGGRKDSQGWTEHKRKANRKKFDALRPFIKTGVTFWYPSSASPAQLLIFNRLHQNFCKEKGLPARAVWEGPGVHNHLALGISHDAELEQKWRSRMSKEWVKTFGCPMPPNAFLWKPEEEPEKLASYLSKTHDKKGQFVKGRFPWLTFNPTWQIGFAGLVKAVNPPRKKRVESVQSLTTEKERHADSPHYTLPTTEKEGETLASLPRNRNNTVEAQKHACQETNAVPSPLRGYAEVTTHEGTFCGTCWHRLGRALWPTCCKCNGKVA